MTTELSHEEADCELLVGRSGRYQKLAAHLIVFADPARITSTATRRSPLYWVDRFFV